MNASHFVTNLAIQGQHYFTTNQMMLTLGLSKPTAWVTITRLEKKGVIATPYRGFHVIVPPEFQRLGCLPPDQFIPDLMVYLKRDYYVGLLSAAQYYGASHQQAQIFQVIVDKNRNKINCGSVRVEFIARKNLVEMPIKKFNTPKGYLHVSTPEVTALDLVNYPMYAGGLSNVVTILEELGEQIQIEALENLVTKIHTTPQLQRLGFMLEMAQFDDLASIVDKALKQRTFRTVALVSKVTSQDDKLLVNKRWKIIQNEIIESDL